MTILTRIRDTSNNVDFLSLVAELDADLQQRYGALQASYDQYNTVEALDTVVVAYFDEHPVACGAFKPYNSTTVEIKRMFVLPEQRGKGLAGSVLRELETWAQELGYARAILETGRKQTEAIRLYRKHGYRPMENYGQYQGVENSVCFQKIFEQ